MIQRAEKMLVVGHLPAYVRELLLGWAQYSVSILTFETRAHLQKRKWKAKKKHYGRRLTTNRFGIDLNVHLPFLATTDSQ